MILACLVHVLLQETALATLLTKDSLMNLICLNDVRFNKGSCVVPLCAMPFGPLSLFFCISIFSLLYLF